MMVFQTIALPAGVAYCWSLRKDLLRNVIATTIVAALRSTDRDSKTTSWEVFQSHV